MSCKYVVVRQTFVDGENTRTGYGVAAVEECDGVVSVLETFGDLSDDENKVKELVRTCNELELDDCQLGDVIDDFLLTV